MIMLRAVTFDLWQTLILDTPEGLRQARADRVGGLRGVLAREGHRVDAADVERAYEAVGRGLETVWAQRRDIGSRGQVRMLLEALGIEGSVPSDGRVMDALDDAYRLPSSLRFRCRTPGPRRFSRSSPGVASGWL